MKLGRKTSYALLAFGVWTWIIWVTFIKNIWGDPRSFSHGGPTAFLTVHLVLTALSIVFGTAIAALGWRDLRASRTAVADTAAEVPSSEVTVPEVTVWESQQLPR